jgi:omega-amidase
MRISACQFDIAWEDKPANFDTVRRCLDQAAPPADALVALPEMFATGFSMNIPATAEREGGFTEHFLAGLARQHGICVVAGVTSLGDGGRARNEAVALSPKGRVLARYCKMRPFRPGGEGELFAAGAGPILFPWNDWTVAPFICYDLRFPELFRFAVVRGAQLLVVLANWPSVRAHHWLPLLRARAIENQAVVVGVNRCGRDPHHVFDGGTVVIDPQGRVVAEAGAGEQVVTADLDLAQLLSYRRDFPVLADA